MGVQDTSAELNGRYIASLVESAGDVSPVFERKVRELFGEYITEDIEHSQWYPVPDVAETYQRIEREVGSSTMREGGAASARAVVWPDEVQTVADGLELLDEMHQQAHRGGTTSNPGGRYEVTITGDREARVAISEDWPYTEPLAEGVFKGVVQSLGGTDAAATLSPVSPRSDEQSAWELTW